MRGPTDAGTVVRALVANLPRSPRLPDVVDAVAARIGRPTRVVDVDGPAWGPLTALVSQSPDENLVLVPAGAPRLYRMHCVLHELGHLVRGDAGAPTPASLAAFAAGGHVCQRALDEQSDADGAALVPVSADDDEHFAEAFAYELAPYLLAGSGAVDEQAYG